MKEKAKQASFKSANGDNVDPWVPCCGIKTIIVTVAIHSLPRS